MNKYKFPIYYTGYILLGSGYLYKKLNYDGNKILLKRYENYTNTKFDDFDKFKICIKYDPFVNFTQNNLIPVNNYCIDDKKSNINKYSLVLDEYVLNTNFIYQYLHDDNIIICKKDYEEYIIHIYIYM